MRLRLLGGEASVPVFRVRRQLESLPLPGAGSGGAYFFPGGVYAVPSAQLGQFIRFKLCMASANGDLYQCMQPTGAGAKFQQCC